MRVLMRRQRMCRRGRCRRTGNTAERAFRGPVIARKNAGGSRNDAAARLAATSWTATATADMAGLNVLAYLTAYLDACGRNGGNPGRPRTGPVPALDSQSRRPAHVGADASARLTRPSHHDGGVTISSEPMPSGSMPAHRTSE
jgi:hypothetical protein